MSSSATPAPKEEDKYGTKTAGGGIKLPSIAFLSNQNDGFSLLPVRSQDLQHQPRPENQAQLARPSEANPQATTSSTPATLPNAQRLPVHAHGKPQNAQIGTLPPPPHDHIHTSAEIHHKHVHPQHTPSPHHHHHVRRVSSVKIITTPNNGINK